MPLISPVATAIDMPPAGYWHRQGEKRRPSNIRFLMQYASARFYAKNLDLHQDVVKLSYLHVGMLRDNAYVSVFCAFGAMLGLELSHLIVLYRHMCFSEFIVRLSAIFIFLSHQLVKGLKRHNGF
jgi:hypothetical protein